MMPFVSKNYKYYQGVGAGNGHCVALVRSACEAPHTSLWKRGAPVREALFEIGTAIATFDANGKYGNHTDGRSHAAILLALDTDGLLVLDQWVGRPAGERKIRFKNGKGKACDDGDRYYIIEGILT